MTEDQEFDIDEAISSWSAGQLRCRARQRHTWVAMTVRLHASSGAPYYEVLERCSSCSNRRVRLMDLSGFWLTRWKMERYRPGYLLPKGSGGIDFERQARIRLGDVLNRKIEEVVDDA